VTAFPRWSFPILLALAVVAYSLLVAWQPADASGWQPGYSVVLALLVATVAYELTAVATQLIRRRTGRPALPTITESVRRLAAKWKWTAVAGAALSLILILHFWFGLW
jgi:hypothetical protein